jgi:hypothetical protein
MSDPNSLIKQVGAIKISPPDDEIKEKKIKDTDVFGVSTKKVDKKNTTKKRKRKKKIKMIKESDL